MQRNPNHDPTLGELQCERGDTLFELGSLRVLVRFVGTGFLLAWKDDAGVPMTKLVTNEADAFRSAIFLSQHGVLPWRPRERKTLRDLQPVRLPC